MKKFILISVFLLGIVSFTNTTNAQNVNISINIGNQPAWGPVGYDYVGYYYFPDINCYYDVNNGLFVYLNAGRWISARYLPYHYRNYDLYVMHKIVLNTSRPWRYNHHHHTNYARYRGHHGQAIIRDSRDRRYYNSRKNNVAWYSHNNNGRPSHNNNSGYHKPNNRPNNKPSVNNNRPNNNNNRPNGGNNYNNRPNNNKPGLGNNHSNKPNNNGNSRPNGGYNQNNKPNKDSHVTRPNNNKNNGSYVRTNQRNTDNNRTSRSSSVKSSSRSGGNTDRNFAQNTRNSRTR